MTLRFLNAVAGTLLALLVANGAAMAARQPEIRATISSGRPSGIARNDRVSISFYPSRTGTPSPAVVILHPLGMNKLDFWKSYARYIARNGIGAAVISLPWHGSRLPAGKRPRDYFTSRDAATLQQAYQQASADASAVAQWLRGRKEVDPGRVGVIGVSLGAIVAHLAMGQDETLSAGVAMMGGGDFARQHQHSLMYRSVLHKPADFTPEDVALLRTIDPVTYAHRNRPRRVLMISATRDLLIPPSSADVLWRALGKPPSVWVDTNHFGLSVGLYSVRRAAVTYLKDAWDSPETPTKTPSVYVPTVTAGLAFGLDSAVTLAVEVEALKFGKGKRHLPVGHVSLGYSGRGAYAGLGVTLNPYVDIGLARRFDNPRIKPYVSFHVAL